MTSSFVHHPVRPALAVVTGLLLFMAANTAWASPPAPQKHREFLSPNEAFVVLVDTTDDVGRKCRITVQTYPESDKPMTVFDTETCPSRVVLGDDGKQLVFVDRFQGGVHDLGLALFVEGAERWRVAVATLLTQEELDEHSLVKGFFSWGDGARVVLGESAVEIELRWGRTFKVNLESGLIE